MADSYYTVIRGKKYDRRMLELAEGLTKGRGDGRISVSDAKNLLRLVKDANSYSPVEKQTMEYIRKKYKFTKDGDAYFRGEIRKWAAGKGKKKPAPKEKKSSPAPRSASADRPEPVLTGSASAIPESPAYTPAPSAKKGSSLTKILLVILLLALIAAAAWFVVFKTSWGKATFGKSAPVPEAPPSPAVPPVTETVRPAAPAVADSKQPAAPSGEAKKPAAAKRASADLKTVLEKTSLTFIAEKTELPPWSLKKIEALAPRIKDENIKIRLTGHTCSLGPKSLNQQISEKRAQVVKDALVARGIPPENIEIRGIADSQTIGNQKTVAGRVASRRVTFKVLQ